MNKKSMFNLQGLKGLNTAEKVKKLNEMLNRELTEDESKAALNSEEKAANDIMHTGNVGFGAEFVKPTTMAEFIISQARLRNPLWTKVRNISMNSPKVEIKIEGKDPVFYMGSESTSSDDANCCIRSLPGTDKICLNAQKFCASVTISAEELEDASIDIMQYIMDKLVLAYNDTIDNVMLNGDIQTGTTNISYSGATIPVRDQVLAFNGIRKVSLTQGNIVNAGTLDHLDVIQARTKLGIQAMDSTNLLLIPSPAVYYNMYSIGQNTNSWTPGLQVTFLPNGEIATFQAMSVHTSTNYAKYGNGSLLASGIVDAVPANNTTGGMAIIHREKVIRGTLRDLKINTFYDQSCDVYRINATFRGALEVLPDGVATLVNVTVQ